MHKNDYLPIYDGNTTQTTTDNHKVSKSEKVVCAISIAIIVIMVMILAGLAYKQHTKNVSAKIAIAEELGVDYDPETINSDMSVYRGNIGYWGEGTFSLTVSLKGQTVYHFTPMTKGSDDYNQVIDDEANKIEGPVLTKGILDWIHFG